MVPGNKNIVLIVGKPACGKTTSLMYVPNQERIAYINADLKELPFKSKFKELNLADPKKIIKAIEQIEGNDKLDSAVLDTVSILMNTYERKYVTTATNTMKAWGAYGSFYNEFISAIKGGTKSYAIMAHTAEQMNEKEMVLDSFVPVKGAVGKVGVEADFTTIIAAKKISIVTADEHPNSLLTVTDREREDGFKYVFQTRITKETIGEKMRSAMDLWDREELYIDNNINLVFKRLAEYYK